MLDVADSALVVSPHLDDAVFGCGALIFARTTVAVCTVFGGTPPEPLETDWDRRCGFRNAHQAMHARLLEDDIALAALGATPLRLPFLDAQYGSTPTPSQVSTALGEALHKCRARLLVLPLGLFHSDHDLVHRACCELAASQPQFDCFGYEEALYRCKPGLVQHRLETLRQQGIAAAPARLYAGVSAVQALAKREAVCAYGSQLHAFGPNGYDDVFAAERYWRLQWPAPGEQRGSGAAPDQWQRI